MVCIVRIKNMKSLQKVWGKMTHDPPKGKGKVWRDSD